LFGALQTFVQSVANPESRDYVQPEDRIATFDNDGTLWVEQPMYVQLAFALDRVKALHQIQLHEEPPAEPASS
jgi:hypothetical protein